MSEQEEKVKKVKVEWKKNEKYELHIYNEDEIEAYRYVYPLLARGYGNYFAHSVYYNAKEGKLMLVYFSDGWNGSGIHFRRYKKVSRLDIIEIAKMKPKNAFEYLYSFFDEFDE
jgi:hypothetical protein